MVYATLSFAPGAKLDLETGELQEINNYRKKTAGRAKQVIEKPYDFERLNYIARQICGKYGEQTARQVLREYLKRRGPKISGNFDAITKSNKLCEIKTGRIGNVCVIIKDQLDKMPVDGFYILVFYKIDGFETATKALRYAVESCKINPEVYLRGKIKVEDIFVFPKSDMIYFYNTCSKIQRKINNNKGKDREFEYAPMKISNAKKLILNKEGIFDKIEYNEGEIRVHIKGNFL